MTLVDSFSRAEHERWMWEAVHEGQKALPGCLPNPPVGCVIVRDGEELARGHTSPPGYSHAEAMALSLTNQTVGATVYVTLEPCSFEGRTPSCAEALIRAAVGHVYVGIIDPHPRNRGKGIDLLRAAGIPVEVGILALEIERFLSPHLIRELADNG